MANYVAVGGDPKEVALINNFIWPFPEEQEMGSLDRSVDAITDMIHALKAPVISGKDSLSSTYRGNGEVIKIPPVLCMSAFGRIPDVEKTVTADIKKGGSTLVLVGQQSPGMAGSTYYDIAGGSSNDMPKIDPNQLVRSLTSMHAAIQSGEVLACHDVSEGGLAAAVSEMAIGGNCGAQIKVPAGADSEEFLFNETAGCFIVEVDSPETAEKLFGDTEHQVIGRTTPSAVLTFSDSYARDPFMIALVDTVKKKWQKHTKELFS